MKITIEVTDTSLIDVIESLKLIGDSGLNPIQLEAHKSWLKHIAVTEDAGPMELTIFRFNNLEV